MTISLTKRAAVLGASLLIGQSAIAGEIIFEQDFDNAAQSWTRAYDVVVNLQPGEEGPNGATTTEYTTATSTNGGSMASSRVAAGFGQDRNYLRVKIDGGDGCVAYY